MKHLVDEIKIKRPGTCYECLYRNSEMDSCLFNSDNVIGRSFIDWSKVNDDGSRTYIDITTPGQAFVYDFPCAFVKDDKDNKEY